MFYIQHILVRKLKIARTMAGLAETEAITSEPIVEAIQYRTPDPWCAHQKVRRGDGMLFFRSANSLDIFLIHHA